MSYNSNNEAKVKSTNQMGRILYTYIQQRNEDIKSFNRFHFNRALDGSFKARPGCEFSNPVDLLDWEELVKTCNNLSKAQADKIKEANSKAYAIYMGLLEDEVHSLIDEAIGYKLEW